MEAIFIFFIEKTLFFLMTYTCLLKCIAFQMLFVIIAFSEHHLNVVVHQIGRIPYIGQSIQQPIRDMLHKQKMALHRPPGTLVEQKTSTLQAILGGIVTLMIFGFLLSIFNSLAQRYHKRLCEKQKLKSA
ncbi:hypothetical protein NECAME_18346 [Necator americanus]|uniref:Uncharacterized protein n=1 Tax=Necator americanus TaxID=51031 RepID=W2SXT7_NECAM|nr:hypothetical protein NECAME_18346 [Necator americanus]ETN73422.1 hypothetical protein NECAME_18346 [Necator americanus]